MEIPEKTTFYSPGVWIVQHWVKQFGLLRARLPETHMFSMKWRNIATISRKGHFWKSFLNEKQTFFFYKCFECFFKTFYLWTNKQGMEKAFPTANYCVHFPLEGLKPGAREQNC